MEETKPSIHSNHEQENLETQMKILMDVMKIPEESRNFLELKNRIERLVEKESADDDDLNANHPKFVQDLDVEEENQDSQRNAKMSDDAMDFIINNPGLQHLAENGFLNLNHERLENCRSLSDQCKTILDNPTFWLKKLIQRGLSQKNQADWIEAIRITRNTDLEPYIQRYLKQSSKNERVVDVPCYINRQSLEKHSELIASKLNCQENHHGISIQDALAQNDDDDYAELFQMLLLFLDDPDILTVPVDGAYDAPIHTAARKGHEKILQILAPMAVDINAPDKWGSGSTAIYIAARYGRTQIVKLLAPLTNNSNDAGSHTRSTPIGIAAIYGFTEIVKILATLTNDPNAASISDCGWTPIHYAARYGHIEILKILAPLTDNPKTCKTHTGKTPMDFAAIYGHYEIIQFLQSF